MDDPCLLYTSVFAVRFSDRLGSFAGSFASIHTHSHSPRPGSGSTSVLPTVPADGASTTRDRAVDTATAVNR